MFRELLESNGYRIAVTNTGASSYPEQIMSIKMVLNDMCTTKYLVVCYYQDIKDYQIEQACLRYCIENGVKLEWLCQDVDGDYMKRILDDEWIDSATFSPATPLEAWLEYHLPRIMPNSRKLIFAILGHDIKIIAT